MVGLVLYKFMYFEPKIYPVTFIGGYMYGNPECQLNGGKYCTLVRFFRLCDVSDMLNGKILRVEQTSSELVDKYYPLIENDGKNIKIQKIPRSEEPYHTLFPIEYEIVGEDFEILTEEEFIKELQEAEKKYPDFIEYL